MICDIERLRAKLKLDTLIEMEAAVQSQVEVDQAWTTQRIATLVAEGAGDLLPRRLVARQAVFARSVRKNRAGVEKPIRARIGEMPVSNGVRTIRGRAPAGV